jgi:hypothetical protein
VAAAKRILQADSDREQVQLELAEYGALLKMMTGFTYGGIDLTLPLFD